MSSKHISRDHSAHKKSVIRPYDEYVRFEVFSHDPNYTKTYIPNNNSLKSYKNATKTSWKASTCFKSTDGVNMMQFQIKYNAKKSMSYRIDFLYEQNNYIYKDKDGKLDKTRNTGKDLTGHCKISGTDYDKNILFDGENNILKRKTIFKHLNKGNHTITVSVPSNVYFMGIIIRNVLSFVGDNYYGDALGSEDGNLALTTCTVTNSDMVKPTEMQVEVIYDDILDCDSKPSGHYIDYMDECNFYVKNNDNKVEQIFGGYVSSVLPDSDRTKLTIHCADRLNEGVNKYILDLLAIDGGTKSQKTDEYIDGMTKNFKSYPQVLKYLCGIHETTLKSNISKDYTVDGEKFHKGLVLTYGKKKKIKKVPTSNGISTPSNNFIMLRNKSSSANKQVWKLYDAKKNAKKPPIISDYTKENGKCYLHITYGLGDKKTSYQTSITETVDNAETTAGSQKFGKCGVSQDGKYVMAIGTISSGHDSGSYGTYYKGVFKNKCPYCHEAKLAWDSCRSDTSCIFSAGWGGSKRSWGVDPIETEITCNGCDSDFSAQGIEKAPPWTKLERVSKITESSKAEQDKLHRGEMVAVPESGLTITPDDIFKAITKEAFKYDYVLGAEGQTWNEMKRTGHGDCWGFSDLIYNMMKKYGIKCKISEYDSGYADNHRSVLYVNTKGEWVNFPYREYGWNTKYNNMLNDTGGSYGGHVIAINKSGSNIGNAKGTSTSTKSKTTTKVTNTKGYDKDKPFQAYLKITYSLEQSFKAKKYSVYVKFTQTAPQTVAINTGLTPYWINNKIRKVTLQHDLADFLRKSVHKKENINFYLQSIHFIAPQVKPKKNSDKKKKEDVNWYKQDKTTNDNSSCKIRLYQITFDDNKGVDGKEFNSCGKSVNSFMQEIVKEAGYLVNMEYGKHRVNDKIHYRVANQTNPNFIASEGDNNNILSWNNISYSPIGSLYNKSVQVFKDSNGKYKYISTRDPTSILEYGEQCTLVTNNETLSEKEAYYNAIMSDKYNPSQTYTYTITVPNYPTLKIGDLVQVRANAKKLNSIKEVKSIKVTFEHDKIPRIQTQIGLDELAPDIQLKKNIRNLRRSAKKESTYFDDSATPVIDEIYYEWDR